jgi:hypothetical protein
MGAGVIPAARKALMSSAFRLLSESHLLQFPIAVPWASAFKVTSIG